MIDSCQSEVVAEAPVEVFSGIACSVETSRGHITLTLAGDR